MWRGRGSERLNEERDVLPVSPGPLEPDRSTAELIRSHARLQALAAASHAFATVATDYSLLLEKIANTTAELIGDGCIVTLLDAAGEHLVNVANAHRDTSIAVDYRAYLAGREISKLDSATVSARVIRSGTPVLVHEINPEDVLNQTDDELKPLVARLNVHSFVVVPIHTQQVVLGTLSLMRSGPGRGYVSDDLTLLQDIADRAGMAIGTARLYQDLERRVRQRTTELEAVNRELEAFNYSVAHDLRAPLHLIEGFSHALLVDYAASLPPAGSDYLSRIRTSTARMSQLIDDLLRFSRTTSGTLQRSVVDLSKLSAAVMARLRDASLAREVEFSVQAGLAVEADRRLVDVVLTNLLGNAWKFSSKRAQARIEVGAQRERGLTVYFVRDNGAGFNPAQAAKLFGVFKRLHGADEFEGTGIGLATVQRIVHRHGGRIWAEAELGAGATFYFTLEPESER